MNTFIAFFRGINVGGKNILPMKELPALFENLGLKNVQTYIQSGNVVFQSNAQQSISLSGKISKGVKSRFGFEPSVLLLTLYELEEAVKSNPFSESESDPKSLHLYFLSSSPKNPDLKKIEYIRDKRESFFLKNRIFYFHAPDGIGKSKLASNIERLLGVSATGRNWRTVTKLIEIANKTK